MPLNWKTPIRSPPVGTHLPVDALTHLTIPLLEGLSYAPLISATLLPELPALPSDEIMTNADRALKRRAQSLMMQHWRSLPLPDYFPYPRHLSPHLFMGLGKLTAGRIHQMRSQKSYWPPTPPGLMLTYPRSAPLVGMSPRGSAMLSSAVPPRPQHGLATSKASPR